MKLHIVNPFENPCGGSEHAAVELFRAVYGRCDAALWSEQAPHPGFREFPVQGIGLESGRHPAGGTLVVFGNYFPVGAWLERAAPARVILCWNTMVSDEWKMRSIERLRPVGSLEVVYESQATRKWVGIDGPVFPARIDVSLFSPRERGAGGRFTVGRLSRDTAPKHHPEDAELYRRLADHGIAVRVMGGTVLRERMDPHPLIELIPAGSEPAPDFLRSLDAFLFRTDWYEAGSRVVCEAMSCGLPVVASRNGGYAEWIDHGRDGFLCDTTGQAEETVLALQRDRVLRRAVGDAARAKMRTLFSAEANRAYADFFLGVRTASARTPRARRVDFAWELGGNTGHVTTLHPVALSLLERGHQVRFLQREVSAGRDLERASEIPREPAPIWVGPTVIPKPLNFGEILHNFGYDDPAKLKPLVDAWRERLWLSHAVVANVAPAAHLAALTLGIPRFEISQGFHIPPPVMPAPPLRDWEPASRAQLEAADGRVVAAMNQVLAAYGVAPLATIGDLFSGVSMLLTYPELDIYPDRGPAEYYGIPHSGEGAAVPQWPDAPGPRAFAYLYGYYKELAPVVDALAERRIPTLLFSRGVPAELRARHAGGTVRFSDEPMSVSRMLPACDLVICHASHQMTAQALLAGKPLLLLPSQLEQFLTMRRVVRMGAGLGIAPDTPDADIGAAVRELAGNPSYTARAQAFADRYRSHDRGAALATLVARCEAALAQGAGGSR